MGKTQGEKNKETYDFYYKKGKMDSEKIYTKKLYDRRFTDEDKEEVVTNTLANQIHIVLRDNPWLLKFMQESLSKTKNKEK